ncbi:MAG: hypothetical protein R3D00_20270 [Bacteroidia bacterium]
MFETIVSVTFTLVGIYLLVGVLFGLFFVFRGVQKTDPGAEGTGLGFRLLILPGAIALWPVLLGKWRKAA